MCFTSLQQYANELLNVSFIRRRGGCWWLRRLFGQKGPFPPRGKNGYLQAVEKPEKMLGEGRFNVMGNSNTFVLMW